MGSVASMPGESELDLLPAAVERVLPLRDSAAVVLQAGEKKFMIFVGSHEAMALQRELMGHRTERPLTHDVISYLMTGFDIQVAKVVISSIVNNVFCATLVLDRDRDDGSGAKDEVRLDIRASDAMVIARKTGVDIWVTRRVLDAVEDATGPLEQIYKQFGTGLEDDPDEDDPGEEEEEI